MRREAAAGALERLPALVAQLLDANPFYQRKYRDLPALRGLSPEALLARLPFLTKAELVADQQGHPPFGSNRTVPLERFTRLHRTSGTSGQPLYWLDTPETWAWWLDCWQEIYLRAGVRADDRVFFPFSFGPFIGFWSAFEAAARLGAMALPGGGLSTLQRLELLETTAATVLVATPTYALHLAEAARERGMDLASGPIRLTLHAGEPGASVPNVKARLEAAWGARAVDHVGATEVGPWGVGCGYQDHLHILESFVAELLPAGSSEARLLEHALGEAGELVLSNPGRWASPVLRYRTGDRVAVGEGPCPCGLPGAYLRGGVIGRVDGMVVVRGVNVFPSAIENLVRGFAEIGEFEAEVVREGELAQLLVRIEVAGSVAEEERVAAALAAELHRGLSLRPRVELVPAGSLPRYELKAGRFKLG